MKDRFASEQLTQLDQITTKLTQEFMLTLRTEAKTAKVEEPMAVFVGACVTKIVTAMILGLSAASGSKKPSVEIAHIVLSGLLDTVHEQLKYAEDSGWYAAIASTVSEGETLH